MKTPRAVPLLLLASMPAAAQQPRSLDTVRVVSRADARRVHHARSVTVISRDDIARTAARTLAQLLATQLGADVLGRSPAQADLALRGSTADQVVVLVDGVRMNDIQTSHFTLDLAVPLDAIERIEVLRGVGSALYGADAVGGVVNIVTRAGGADGRPLAARARGGSFGTAGGVLDGGWRVGRVGAGGALEGERSDGHRPGTDYRTGQGTLTASAPVGAGGGTARAALGGAARDFGAADFYAPYQSYERTRTGTASARYESAPARPWGLTTQLATRRHEDNFILIRGRPSVYQNRHTSWHTDAQVVVRRSPAGGPLAAAVGAEHGDARLTSTNLGRRREVRDALFGEGSLAAPSGAGVTAGARLDRSSSAGSFFSPSLAATLPALGGRVRLRANADRGFRAPTWTERFYRDPVNQGTAGLRPERFWAGEVGVRALPRWGVVDAAWFARRATNLIDWTRPAGAPATTPWVAMNVGAATYQGAEAEVTLPGWRRTTWVLRGSALSLRTDAAAGLMGKYALRPLTRTAGARLTTPLWSGAEVTADALLARRRGERLSQELASARLTQQLGAARLVADVMNLTNADYLDVSGKAVAGRGVYVGLEWVR